MIRHKRHPWNKVIRRMCDEENEETDLGRLITLLHRYGDYFLVEAIRREFKNAERLLDGGPLDTYSSRLTLLDSVGFFDEHESVLENLRILNRLRNFYAHDITVSKVQPNNVRNLIRSMKSIDIDGSEIEPDAPWNSYEDEYLARIHICSSRSVEFVQLIVAGFFEQGKGTRRTGRQA